MTNEDIARICHEMNRRFCQLTGDDSQPAWEDAPAWQRSSAISGVEFTIANPDAPPSASHDSWWALKKLEGWVYGETKDPKAKTHPCCVPYEQLPPVQRAKDHIFQAVVRGLSEVTGG
jgi:hypothetical protein